MKARGTVCRPLPGEPGLAQDAFWREQRDLAAPPLGQGQMRDERERTRVELVARTVLASADATGHVRKLDCGQIVRKLRPDVDQLDIGRDRAWRAFRKFEPQA